MEAAGSAVADFPEGGLDFEEQISRAEKNFLQLALLKSDGVRTRAADLLKISYRSFRHYAKKHSL
jgi:two-component system response regulator PilR (NtrC family)